MWQAQLKGSKTWYLLPPPECEEICSKLTFLVEPGDAGKICNFLHISHFLNSFSGHPGLVPWNQDCTR